MSTHAKTALPYPRASTWYQRIRNARVRGTFTPTEVMLATSWNRCAIGERFDLKDEHGRADSSPLLGQGTLDTKDVKIILEYRGVDVYTGEDLLMLGSDFLLAVEENDFALAEGIRRKIAKTANGW